MTRSLKHSADTAVSLAHRTLLTNIAVLGAGRFFNVIDKLMSVCLENCFFNYVSAVETGFPDVSVLGAGSRKSIGLFMLMSRSRLYFVF